MDIFIADQLAQLREVTRQVQTDWSCLSAAQLNWKPDSARWSIAQILDHLMVTNRTYFPQFDTIISGTYRPTLYQRLPVVARLIGRQLVKDLGPNQRKAFKNPAQFAPAQSDLPAAVVNHFVSHQAEMEAYFKALDGINLKATVISSPVSRLITYRLHDALGIITGHEQRHLQQARQLAGHPDFPDRLLTESNP